MRQILHSLAFERPQLGLLIPDTCVDDCFASKLMLRQWTLIRQKWRRPIVTGRICPFHHNAISDTYYAGEQDIFALRESGMSKI